MHYSFLMIQCIKFMKIMYNLILSIAFNYLALSEDALIKIKDNRDLNEVLQQKEGIIKCLKKKGLLFFIIGVIILLFFWYYISCFCAVYNSTQGHLFKDTVISFLTGMLYPFPLTLIPALLRVLSLKNKNFWLFQTSRIVTLVISII